MGQVKELRYTASQLIGALRFARGFKKAPITHREFEPKSNFFGNLKLDFFPIKKSFSQIFQNTANFFYLNFTSVNFHKNQRTYFCGKKCLLPMGFLIFFSPILKLEVGFFFRLKIFFTYFPN